MLTLFMTEHPVREKKTASEEESQNNVEMEGGGWGMGMKGGTCYNEHWVLHVRDELPNSTPVTNITLNVN